MLREGAVHTVAASDDKVCSSDRVQRRTGEGPCIEAIASGADTVRVTDSRTAAKRWPKYAAEAEPLGIASMIAFPLFAEKKTLGALNIYSSRPGALTKESENTGWLLASHAAVAIDRTRREADLHVAISSRQRIGQAMGILMALKHISADEAFALLAKMSQDRNIKLRELARRIVATGALR